MDLSPKTHLIDAYPILSFIVQVLSGFSGTKEDFFPFYFFYWLVLSFPSGLNLVLVLGLSSTFFGGAKALYRNISQ